MADGIEVSRHLATFIDALRREKQWTYDDIRQAGGPSQPTLTKMSKIGETITADSASKFERVAGLESGSLRDINIGKPPRWRPSAPSAMSRANGRELLFDQPWPDGVDPDDQASIEDELAALINRLRHVTGKLDEAARAMRQSGIERDRLDATVHVLEERLVDLRLADERTQRIASQIKGADPAVVAAQDDIENQSQDPADHK